MAEKKSFCKIQTTDGKEYYLLSAPCEDEEHGFDLSVTNGHEAWSGTVSEDELRKMARKIKMKFEDYLDQCRRALMRQNMGSVSYIYQMKPEAQDDDITFVWKKHITSDDIKVQLGSAFLCNRPEPTSVYRRMFEYALEVSVTLQEKITSLETDNERLSSERSSALKRLEKCVAGKEELEKDLYSKFAAVLNNKKEKLRNLRNEVEDLKAVGPNTSPEPGPSTSRRTEPDDHGDGDSDNNAAMDMSDHQSEHGSDSEYNTDEDEKPSTSRRKKVTVKAEVKDEGDSSLLLDDGLDNTSPAPTKRRRRGGIQSAKKQTPSKPILPKVSSSEAKQRAGRGSLRKSTSVTSGGSRSSENIDADDLMGDF